MKVLHLLGATEDNGGILSTLRGLSTASASIGITHAVWVNEAYVEKRTPALDYRRARHALDESSSHLRLAWHAWRSVADLRRLLQSEPFDILHAHTRGAFALSVLFQRQFPRPIVFTNHTYARRIGMYRWGANQHRLISVVLTPNMARHYGLTVDDTRVHCIPECCPDAFLNAPLRDPGTPKASNTPIRLLGIGNIVRWKKWNLLLEALAALPQSSRNRFHFHHWGPTPAEPDAIQFDAELKRQTTRLQLASQVTWHGSTRDVPAQLLQSEWFVLPSTNEPCSVALLEALAHGVPALVSRSGGNVDIVTPGLNGSHFDPDDAASLSRQLHQIAAGETSLARPTEIRDSVRRYSASRVAAAYGELYRRIGS